MILHIENCEHKEDDNNDHDHSHGHDHRDNPDSRHDHPHGHACTHGIIDPSFFTPERGIRAVKWSFAGLFPTAFIQIIIE
jgi:ABC-type Zn2+ transport system substrate-binding protein/surface adhesin